MKYKITIASNTSDFYTVALMEIASGPEKFANLNSLLEHLSTASPKVTLASIENFFRAGGVMAVVTLRDKVVGIATLVIVTKVNGATGRIEHVVVHPKHRGKGLSHQMTTELIKVAKEKKLRYRLIL